MQVCIAKVGHMLNRWPLSGRRFGRSNGGSFSELRTLTIISVHCNQYPSSNEARERVLRCFILTLLGLPAFEDDYFRFIWDGWRTLQVGTPYGVAPEIYFGDGSVPSALRAVLDGVNYPEHPTIYGPFLQLVFAGVFALFGTNLIGLQLLFAAANLLLIALLLRRQDPGKVALYAWNPLVIAETSLHLHPDGLLAAALFAALLAGRARPVMMGFNRQRRCRRTQWQSRRCDI
jgi:hypothetical protein